MLKNKCKLLECAQTPVKSMLYTNSTNLTSKIHIKSYLFQTVRLIKMHILLTKSSINNKKNNINIEVHYFHFNLKLKIFILYGQIYFKIFLYLTTNNYSLQFKVQISNLYKSNREYMM